MEFKIIETQEQFDSMVKDRVERAKESARKEFAEQIKAMESMKEQLTGKDTELTALKAKIDDLSAEKAKTDESYKSMQNELSKVKLDALKQKIAIEEGVPIEIANRLTGDDEETIRKDAEMFKGFAGSKRVPPGFNQEDKAESELEEGFRAMARATERK